MYMRVSNHVRAGLGPELQIGIDSLSQIMVLVMEYVEDIKTALEMTPAECHAMVLDFVEKILFDYGGGIKLPDALKKLLSDMISRLCEAAKGLVKFNTGSSATSAGSSATLPAATAAPAPALVAAPAPVATVAVAATPEKKKKHGTFNPFKLHGSK